MDWGRYYKERPMSLERYNKDTQEHEPFLNEIIATCQKDRTMLEVGSGSGAISIFLSRLDYKILSVDNNDGVLDIAKRNNDSLNGNVTFGKADAFSLPFKDDNFDVCFSQGFFEHFDDGDIRKLIKEQLRVSKYAIFSVPSFSYPVQEFGDERLMEKEAWLKILDRYKVSKAVYYGDKRGVEANPSQIYFEIVK